MLTEKELEAIKPHLNAESAAKLTAENGVELLTAQMHELSLLAVEQSKALKESETKALSTISMDPDALEMSVDLTLSKLDSLVAAGSITPAVSKALSAALVGPETGRNVYALSRKATGGTKPLATLVLDALKDNKPVKLGEKTASQQTQKKLELSRSDAQEDDKLQEDITNRMVAAANAGRR